ncbi:hypothetical protein CEV32_2133 [Brucella rhizosphaerae]|uniref:Uncharacterized protein n=1 Tax=Brucella rhizosphaerae TaxID=571254 RepID=A0A256F4C7_9HYPH|nr:hypothetical protein CEV32_2133 [Brucella rhizosphaerae]
MNCGNADRTIIGFFSGVIAICACRIDQHMVNSALFQHVAHYTFCKRRTADIACTDEQNACWDNTDRGRMGHGTLAAMLR